MNYRSRLTRSREGMRAAGLDALLVAPSADLTYLTGLRAKPGDRLTALLLPAGGEAVLLVPTLEAAGLDAATLPGDLLRWPDGSDPLDLIVARLDGAGAVGVGENLWARDLLPLQARLPAARIVSAAPILRPLRVIKDEAEINLLRRAAHAADQVFEHVCAAGLEGRSEREVAGLLERLLVEEGHDAPAFTIVASGPNAASPHHATGDRRIARGDLVTLDFGGSIDGYSSDITRTVAVGEPGEAARGLRSSARGAGGGRLRGVAGHDRWLGRHDHARRIGGGRLRRVHRASHGPRAGPGRA